MHDAVYIFPDTNVFLHYKQLREIDWLEVADAASATIIVCMPVVHELDFWQRDARLGDRAKRALKAIETETGTEIRPKVKLEQSIETSSLPPNPRDEQIRDLADKHRQASPGIPTMIATADYGMTVLAKARGLSCIRLDDRWALPPVQDADAKKVRELNAEVARLKARQGDLIIGLSLPGGEMLPPDRLKFRLPKYAPIDVDQQMGESKRKHPKTTEPTFRLPDSSPRNGDWKTYDEEIERYRKDLGKHLKLVNSIAKAKSRCIRFDLWVNNIGSAPATDIDVKLHFPALFHAIYEEDSKEFKMLHSTLKPPAPPDYPQHRSILDPVDLMGGLNWRPEIPVDFDFPNLQFGVEVEDTDSGIAISGSCGRLKHDDSLRLGSFVAVFAADTPPQSFNANGVLWWSEGAGKIQRRVDFIIEQPDEK